VIAVVTVVSCGAIAGSARATPAVGSSLPMVAPYLDMGEQHPANLYGAINSDNLRYFSAGFVISHGCTPTWDDGVAIAKDPAVTNVVSKARSLGAQAIVSFGGAGGKDPARTCHNDARLLAEYESVVEQLSPKYVDFDIEGAALAEPVSIARRFAAIKALETQFPDLVVSLTIPVLPHGLDGQSLALLRDAAADGARIDLVNVMTMDYGGGSIDMGQAAVAAATATLPQLQEIWPASTYANLGITPMIGKNDDTRETFTLANARLLRRFARSHHVGRLAFWSIGRDNGCVRRHKRPTSTCSGVAQSRLDFTRALLD
jgi:hypothetical protein